MCHFRLIDFSRDSFRFKKISGCNDKSGLFDLSYDCVKMTVCALNIVCLACFSQSVSIPGDAICSSDSLDLFMANSCSQESLNFPMVFNDEKKYSQVRQN